MHLFYPIADDHRTLFQRSSAITVLLCLIVTTGYALLSRTPFDVLIRHLTSSLFGVILHIPIGDCNIRFLTDGFVSGLESK